LKEDPYLTLGVERDISHAELKRVFRRLAMTWHPDRNDDPQATARFTEIRAAYEALLEPEDDVAVDDWEPDDEAPPDEPQRAADIRLNLEISLAEAWAGCDKTLNYVRGKDCPTCKGSGEHGLTRTRFCEACHGSGRVRDKKQGLVSCSDCVGRGFFSERICPDCAGSGRQQQAVSLKVKVPAGILPGDDLRLIGQGVPGEGGLHPGDLFLTIVIKTHAIFELRGRDIYLDMPVNALAMIAGAEIEIPLPVGTKVVQLEAGAASKRVLRFSKNGFPGRGKAVAGDLIVGLQPVFPARLTARQRKLLLQIQADLSGDLDQALPEVAAWWQKIRAAGAAEN
jgi:molecular chaperone DnaJ